MKTDKWIAVLGSVLFVSLSINLFMAGMVVGRTMRPPHEMMTDAVAQDHQLRDGLSDSDRQVLKQAMEANRAKIMKLHDDIESIKKDMQNLIRSEHFDEKALEAVLTAEKDKKMQFLELIHETRETAMKQMSPEGRRILSKMSRMGFDMDAGPKGRRGHS